MSISSNRNSSLSGATAESKLLELLETASLAVAMLDTDWKICYYNSRLPEMLGLPFDYLQDGRWQDWLCQHALHLPRKRLDAILKNRFRAPLQNLRLILRSSEDTPFEKHLLLSLSASAQGYRLLHLQEIASLSQEEQDALTFSRSMQRDLKMAKRIQNHFNNNTLSRIEGRYFIHHFFSHFRPSFWLSGDVMNINQINRRYYSIFMGDGRGHGLTAALYSPIIYSYINILAREVAAGESNLASLMEMINLDAHRDFSRNQEFYFFSGLVALVDGNSDWLYLVNAGHPPPFLYKNGQLLRFQATGPLVGVIPDARYEQVSLQLAGDEIFIFFTDGVFEVQNARGEHFSDELLTLFIEDYFLQKKPVEELATRIMEYLDSYAGKGKISDDISLLVIATEKKY